MCSNEAELGYSYELLEVARAQKAVSRARELFEVRLLAEQLLRTSICRRKVREARQEVEVASITIGRLSAHIRNQGGSLYSPPMPRGHRRRNVTAVVRRDRKQHNVSMSFTLTSRFHLGAERVP
jgi:hypothetical protein